MYDSYLVEEMNTFFDLTRAHTHTYIKNISGKLLYVHMLHLNIYYVICYYTLHYNTLNGFILQLNLDY